MLQRFFLTAIRAFAQPSADFLTHIPTGQKNINNDDSKTVVP